jgi:hypothetical protein
MLIFLYRAGAQVLWLLQQLLFVCYSAITCHQILIRFFPKMVNREFVCVVIIYLLSHVNLPVWEYELLHMLFIALNKKKLFQTFLTVKTMKILSTKLLKLKKKLV